ncbi:cellulose synthase [Pseudorhizobium endolithicum]|uniref:Cellulose synthase n=2 Tax=Pseudorhizobium endolithicum TaxID=1191678 RepID=A0ABN7K0F4_9HYPH|nr:cellulose synthase [Pseudorhizobium endolithicum]
MSLKLPVMMVTATLVAGLYVTQSDQPFSSRLHSSAVGQEGGALRTAQIASEEGEDIRHLEDAARNIRALQEGSGKTERLAQPSRIVPFQLSQVDYPDMPPEGTGNETGAEQQPPQVDESALRYFAAQGDQERLAAEIARLRQLYPDWTPPEDPLAVPQNADRQLESMWQLYAEGRYPEVRKAIVERQAAEPAWQPPADLLDRLGIAEARSRLVNASNLKQYQTVIEVGASNPALLNCTEVDVLWRVAEAFANTERPQRAVDAYSYILANCTDPGERAATVQKAAGTLPYGQVQPLLALEKSTADGGREFDAIRDDLARRFVSEANEEPALEIAPEYVERLRDLAAGRGTAADAVLLGWYHLRRDNAGEAETWFRRAKEREDSAEASQGLALVLLEGGKPAEAEAVLHRWRESSEDTMATYLAATANLLAADPPPTIEDEVLTRMAQAVIARRYAPSAQQFGWYARAFDQPETAAQWFETALQWAPEDEPSAYGLALTRQQLNDRAGFAEIQQAWAERSARIADLAATPSSSARVGDGAAPAPAQVANAPAAVRAARNGVPESRNVVAQSKTMTARSARTSSCTSRVDISRLSPGAALARGWCLMELNRPLEAADSFGVAILSNNRTVSEDAAYGQSLAYLRLGLTDRAAVAATRAPMAAARAREPQASILADRAIQAFQSERFREALLYLDQRMQVQQEPVDLMVLRGYSYMNLNRPYDALRIFEAAAATGSRDASRGLADAKEAVGLN